MKHLLYTGFCAASLMSVSALAHHSATQYDLTIRDYSVSGVVKEFTPGNPHTKIVLEITDEKGTRDVEFEGHSRNNFYRSGWRVGMVEVGDKVTVNAGPKRDGSDGGYVIGVILEDGKRF